MKKNKQPKFILLLILIVCAALMFTSACSSDSDSVRDGASADNSDEILNSGEDNLTPDEDESQPQPKEPLDLPDIKYGGYDFRVMNINQSAVGWMCTIITSEEDTGAEVNDAVYIRNRIVEDRFDINIIELGENSVSTIQSKASRSIQAGSDDYDLFILNSAEATSMARRQLLMDYDLIPWIELEKSYWDTNMKRDLSVGERVYLMTGDFSMMHYSLT